ncbi:MAG TPA: hypothetical protein VIC05_11595 [Solirubrobacteraceae bacterium]|jgi:hypothetical protein
MISHVLRITSRVICLIVIASFVIFVVGQTSSASQGQQQELASGTPNASTEVPAAKRESTLHKTIDEASSRLTSPFSGFTSGTTNQWIIRGADTLLALLIYGFGLGFLARVLSIKT